MGIFLRALIPFAGIYLSCASTPGCAGEVRKSTFGKMLDGREVTAIKLENAHGISANIITYGATLQSLVMPDSHGQNADVVLGYDNIGDYLANPQYFGATVGRFANRIAGGRFGLDGQFFQTPINNGKNALHGGKVGFDKVLWEIVSLASGPVASVNLRYVSPDGDQGYPGTLTVNATYSLDEQNNLTIDYSATTDRATIANITNHTYWALSGEGSARSAMGLVVTIPAETYLPTDSGAIPLGAAKSVANTAFDFRTPQIVGARVRDASDEQIAWARGYDHNWVIGREITRDQHLMAKAYDPASGRGFELWSNQPGLQFYSGNFLDGTTSGKTRKMYREGDAIVMEPQIFPDSPNQTGYPSARLNPGQTYHNTMTYRLVTGLQIER